MMSWLGKLFGRSSSDSIISDVQLRNNYYYVINTHGKEVSKARASSVGELCGIGNEFILFQKNNYYTTYNARFKKINEVRMSSVGNFEQITANGIQFNHHNKLEVYNKNLDRIS